VLGYLHANDEQRLEAAKDKFLNAYAITDSRPETEPLIKGILQ
jgi:thymidine phosphorylase